MLSLWTLVLIVASFAAMNCSSMIDIDGGNIHKVLSQQPVLLEFKAPWCSACESFKRTYAQIADTLTDEWDFQVGAVDIDENPATASRFEVYSIPALYLYTESQMYLYDGPLTKDSILKFCTSGYKTEEPLSYMSSPMGPSGRLKGLLIRVGYMIVTLPPYVSDKLGVPVWAALIMIGVFGGFVMLSSVGLGIYYSVVHAKND